MKKSFLVFMNGMYTPKIHKFRFQGGVTYPKLEATGG